MVRLLLKMLLLPPDVLKSHAQGYVDLASEVGARYVCTLKNRWVMYALSFLTLMLALMALVALRSTPLVLALVLACCGLGYVYQGPPFRLGYRGLGEPLCWLAFGPLATAAVRRALVDRDPPSANRAIRGLGAVDGFQTQVGGV